MASAGHIWSLNGDATVVVLRHRHLSDANMDEIESLAERDDGPAVVVIADEADPQQRTELIAPVLELTI